MEIHPVLWDHADEMGNNIDLSISCKAWNNSEKGRKREDSGKK